MGWSTWLARAIRSIVSTEVIHQLCPQPLAERVVETETPREITAIVTHTYLAILKPVDVMEEPLTTIEDQSVTVFNNIPGLTVHPLAVLFIILTVVTLLSCIFSCLIMCRSRSQQAYRAGCYLSASRQTEDQEIAATREHYLKQELLRTQRELTQTETMEEQLREALNHLDSSKNQLEQLALDNKQLSQTIARSSELEHEIESLTSDNLNLDTLNDIANKERMKLSKDVDKLTQENKELKEDNASKHRRILTFRENYKDSQARFDAATKEIEQFKCDTERLNEELQGYHEMRGDKERLLEQLEDYESIKIKFKAHSEATVAKDIEIGSLRAEKEVLQRNEISNLSKLEEAYKKCNEFQALLSDATKQIRELKQDKGQLAEQLQDYEKVSNEATAHSEAVAARDKKVTTLRPTKAHQKQPKLQIKALRVGTSEARILRNQVSKLHRQCSQTQNKLQTKTNDLIATQEELNNQKGQSGVTKMNYDYLAGRYEVEKQAAEELRSEVTITRAVMKEILRDLNIPSTCAELVPSGRPKVMKSKDVAQRRRTRLKMFDTGASSFKFANGQRGRSLSIAGCETRLEVARLLPGRSKHLMTAEENEVLDLDHQENPRQAARLSAPDFQDVMSALNSGRLPYTPEVLHYLMSEHTTNTHSSGLLTSTSTEHVSPDPVVDLEHRANDTAFLGSQNTIRCPQSIW